MSDYTVEDVLDRLPKVFDCFIVGSTIGRPPKITVEHLDTLLDMLYTLVKEMKERKSSKAPKLQHIKDLTKALQYLSKARTEYYGDAL